MLVFIDSSATSAFYTLSLHDALPIWRGDGLPPAPSEADARVLDDQPRRDDARRERERSEEHTSELQSRFELVCRLLLEKKKPLCTNAILTFVTSSTTNCSLPSRRGSP